MDGVGKGGKMGKTANNSRRQRGIGANSNLKQRLYRSLYGYGVAVFSPEDIVSSAGLALCGCPLPVSGIELLRLLVELAHEGKVVIWQDDTVLGFLPAKIWEREMADIKSAMLREECEALRLKAAENLRGTTMAAVLARVLPPKPGYKPCKDRGSELDKTPNHRHGKGNHKPAHYGKGAGEESVIPANHLGEPPGEEADCHHRNGSQPAYLSKRDAGERVNHIQFLLPEPDPLDNQGHEG